MRWPSRADRDLTGESLRHHEGDGRAQVVDVAELPGRFGAAQHEQPGRLEVPGDDGVDPVADEGGGSHRGDDQSRVHVASHARSCSTSIRSPTCPAVRRAARSGASSSRGTGLSASAPKVCADVTTTRWRTPAAAAAVMTVWATAQVAFATRPRAHRQVPRQVGARGHVCRGVDSRERRHQARLTGVGVAELHPTHLEPARCRSPRRHRCALRRRRRRAGRGGRAAAETSARSTARPAGPAVPITATSMALRRERTASSPPAGNSPWPPRGCLVRDHPLRTARGAVVPDLPRDPRPA